MKIENLDGHNSVLENAEFRIALSKDITCGMVISKVIITKAVSA